MRARVSGCRTRGERTRMSREEGEVSVWSARALEPVPWHHDCTSIARRCASDIFFPGNLLALSERMREDTDFVLSVHAACRKGDGVGWGAWWGSGIMSSRMDTTEYSQRRR